MYGYANKILWVDLSRGEAVAKALEEGLALRYIGGKGLGAKILHEEVPPKVDPYDPANVVVFATGPVNGLALSGAAKFCAAFKSPLTNAWGESYCSGHFAPHLKRAGYDAIVIRGRSKEAVYLVVSDEGASLKDASHLWGKDSFEAEEAIKRDHGRDFQVLSIGPAGENLVRYACVSHDKGRQFGRCGAGAVMGSKKLKAVAARGTKAVEVARPEELEAFRDWLNKEASKRLRSLTEYGTPAMAALTNATFTLPTRNWREGGFERIDEIDAEAMKERIVKRNKACFACVVACGKLSKVERGPYAGTEVEGPEYETLFAFGPLCENANLESIAKANELCDRLGLDTISSGSAIAFAMECYGRGLLTKEDVGLELKFGDHEAIVALLKKIAYREGFGNVLAEGVKRAAEAIGKGAEEFAVHVKGLEPPGYDPRGLKGVALAYAVSARGACHLRHMAYRPNLYGRHPFREDAIDRLSYEGQAGMVKEQEDFYALVDSMVLCKFLCLPITGPILWDELIKLYSIVTGLEVKKEEFVKVAERINNLVKEFNLREGLSKKDDFLPKRLMKEPVKGQVVDEGKLNEALNKYYELRGWA